MNPEIWVVVGAVFVCGGAIGSVGTLLAQWVLRKVTRPAAPPRLADPAEVEMLKVDIAELGRHVRNLDDRLDFTEQLLGGAVPTTRPPPRLESPSVAQDRDTPSPSEGDPDT